MPKKSAEAVKPIKKKIDRIQIGSQTDVNDKLDLTYAWYVGQVYSNYENYVMQALDARIKEAKLESYFQEIIVPTEEVVEMRNGQQKKSERKFYPGYILIKMHMNEETWHLVRKTNKVLGFIGGTSSHPSPITETEANNLLYRIQEGVGKPRPKTLFEPGEVVRVTEGPFADFNGVVEEVDYEKSRLRVAVLIFGRQTPVELEFGQVSKA